MVAERIKRIGPGAIRGGVSEKMDTRVVRECRCKRTAGVQSPTGRREVIQWGRDGGGRAGRGEVEAGLQQSPSVFGSTIPRRACQGCFSAALSLSSPSRMTRAEYLSPCYLRHG